MDPEALIRKRLRLAASRPCPCGKEGKAYADCCGPWHEGLAQARHASTPEALMRSRYSAYVLGLPDYLIATWHPSTAPGDLELQAIKWIALEVLNTEQSGDAGVVEFVARYRDTHGRAGKLHEVSRFVREGVGDAARWLYIDGQQPAPD